MVQPQSSTNQAPTDISLDNDKVAEGKDGAAIGKLTTTDPDAGDQHTYKVSDDRFEVTADGTLKLKAGQHLDYATEKTVNLQITSDDGHDGTYNKTFTLNVQDDPNYPPVNPPQPQPNHEGDVAISGNAKVGETLTAQVHDADNFDEAKVNYQWQRDGQPIANANGKTYTLTAEDEGHKISVKAEYTDNAGNKESHDAESGVVQPQSSTNQAPTDITLDNDKVAEGKDGAEIGKLTTTDPDAGDQHTYKVSDDRFEVTADGTLKLKDGKHLDFATEPKVTLQVSSDDGHGGTTSKEFTLQVQDDPNYPTPNPQPPQPPQPQPNHAGTVSITGEA
ncbi:hypothetical protein HMPREF0198_2184, partial [Cardiobacterium hominis ATCC 15826]